MGHPHTLDTAIGAFLQAGAPALQPSEQPVRPALRAIAVDGKTVHGSRTATATAVQLLTAMDHHGVVLAQRQIDSKSNEIPASASLLDTIDLENTVLPGDALHPARPRRLPPPTRSPLPGHRQEKTTPACLPRSGSRHGPTCQSEHQVEPSRPPR